MGPGERFFRDPTKPEETAMGKLPDFLLKDNTLLRRTMEDRGWRLTIAERQADLQKGRGRMYVATYAGPGKSVQTAQSDENLAVCVAALKVFGFPISDDNEE